MGFRLKMKSDGADAVAGTIGHRARRIGRAARGALARARALKKYGSANPLFNFARQRAALAAHVRPCKGFGLRPGYGRGARECAAPNLMSTGDVSQRGTPLFRWPVFRGIVRIGGVDCNAGDGGGCNRVTQCESILSGQFRYASAPATLINPGIRT